jgi:hypothetical protein
MKSQEAAGGAVALARPNLIFAATYGLFNLARRSEFVSLR